jgi:glycosyltransferase involved in cell wall biosynthesis
MSLRIAHLTDSISNNGVTRVLLALTRFMSLEGVENTLVTFRPPENQSLADQFQCHIHNLDLAKASLKPKFLKSKWDVLGSSAADSSALDTWATENAIDFVFIHGRPILRFFKTRVPHAVVAHNTKSKMYLPRPGSPRRGLIRSRVRKIYSSQPVISVSEGIRQDFIDQFDVPGHLIQTIYNPLDIRKIRELATEQVSDIPARPYFVAAGKAARVKRFDILLRAFALSTVDADLVMLGEGSLTQEYKKLAENLGVRERVHFPGYRANPYPYFKRALALVVSSHYEGLGMGIIEALACGTSVVSTDCPSGPGEILQNALAEFLVPVGDVKALAEAMEKVVAHPYRYPESQFEKFNPSRVARAYKEFACRYI